MTFIFYTVIIPRMETSLTQKMLEELLERVKKRLNKLNITEHALEIQAKAKVGTIRNWRRGALPRIDTLFTIAPALCTTPEWLAFGVGEEETTKEDYLIKEITMSIKERCIQDLISDIVNLDEEQLNWIKGSIEYMKKTRRIHSPPFTSKQDSKNDKVL
ncbi:hypothetical protein [Liberibacter crescens]|nr:hypothetical protein [Liberibacter crescens]